MTERKRKGINEKRDERKKREEIKGNGTLEIRGDEKKETETNYRIRVGNEIMETVSRKNKSKEGKYRRRRRIKRENNDT